MAELPSRLRTVFGKPIHSLGGNNEIEAIEFAAQQPV